uniref:Caspase family protein n=1 Tax=Desulfobacca acetoxidans TaxID=60893 RepID=A0A7V4LDP6_9BACT
MAKGMALTIGLNAVDPRHYEGWSGELVACEADAADMADIARSKGFEVATLLTKAATRANVVNRITQAAQTLGPGDIFLLTYSGHGGQLPDLNRDEADAKDETWCLYDGQLVDDEIFALLATFQTGVRLLVFSDSCHSGTVIKLAYYEALNRMRRGGEAGPAVRYRFMPAELAPRVYRAHRDFYDPILRDPKLRETRDMVKASALLISGCQDNQYSQDGAFNGLFTGTLLQIWNAGKFKGDYRKFYRAICTHMPPDQTPNYYRVGKANTKFEKQTPFTI